jgi:hypothetical protein
MVPLDRISDLVHSGGLTRPEQLLLCLAHLGDGLHVLGAVRATVRSLGLSDANMSRDLLKLKGLAFQSNASWALTTPGKKRVQGLVGAPDAHVATQSSALRSLLPKLKDDMRDFVEEAVACYESRHFRAAVVLSWVGAVSVLYAHVVQHRLADFNAEALRRDAKWRTAKNEDDLSRMKEHDFLQVLEALSILGKNVKNELEACLKLRNGCGHPNSLKLSESRSAAHIEVLVLNVFNSFA